MPAIRSVEYYRLWENHTWDTDFIDIPADMPDDRFEEAVREAAARIDWREGPPVLVGLYCSNDEENTVDQCGGAVDEDESQSLPASNEGAP